MSVKNDARDVSERPGPSFKYHGVHREASEVIRVSDDGWMTRHIGLYEFMQDGETPRAYPYTRQLAIDVKAKTVWIYFTAYASVGVVLALWSTWTAMAVIVFVVLLKYMQLLHQTVQSFRNALSGRAVIQESISFHTTPTWNRKFQRVRGIREDNSTIDLWYDMPEMTSLLDEGRALEVLFLDKQKDAAASKGAFGYVYAFRTTGQYLRS